MNLRNIRRIYSVFFITLFVYLLWITNFKELKGYEVQLFLELDPLVAFSGFITSFTVYKGLLLSLLIVIPTLFFGRFFCSWICPMGILNHWISHIFNKRRPVDDYNVNLYKPVYRLKYYILIVLLLLSAGGALQIGLFDPIALITRSFTISVLNHFNYLKQPIFYGGVLISVIFLAILFANRFITRFWCRTLCPLGAFLGLLSTMSLFRIRRDVDKCTDCRSCQRYCQGGCNPNEVLKVSECHVCMNCVEECPEGAVHFGLAKETSSTQQSFDINKRRLIETAVLGMAFSPMLRGSLSAYNTISPNVIRPPGSLAEHDFLSRCIKCGQCMKVCPTNVIQPALLETGFEGLWTPVLFNKIGYCEYNCVLCGQVCPTGAIMPLTVEEKLKRKIGTAFYNRGRCLPWAMNIECIVCEEVCPTSPKAIWFESVDVTLRDGKAKKLKRPYVDTKLCVGCGICEKKCPVRDEPAIYVTSIGEARSKTNSLMLNL